MELGSASGAAGITRRDAGIVTELSPELMLRIDSAEILLSLHPPSFENFPPSVIASDGLGVLLLEGM